MINTMHEANGAGLAANQIFKSISICVIEVINNSRYTHIENIPLKVLINPKIKVLDTKNTFNSYEGCLSVPNLRGKVRRYSHIKIDYFDQKGEKKVETVSGFNSIVYQHEIDHLDGYLFTDKVTDNTSLVTYQNYLKFHEKDYNKELTNFVKNTKNLS
jgi:peptide deformylase